MAVKTTLSEIAFGMVDVVFSWAFFATRPAKCHRHLAFKWVRALRVSKKEPPPCGDVSFFGAADRA